MVIWVNNNMDIDEKEKAILQRIVTDDAFDIMNRIASALLMNWNKNPIDQPTAFLTAKEAIGREQRKKALVSFLETIEKLAHGS